MGRGDWSRSTTSARPRRLVEPSSARCRRSAALALHSMASRARPRLPCDRSPPSSRKRRNRGNSRLVSLFGGHAEWNIRTRERPGSRPHGSTPPSLHESRGSRPGPVTPLARCDLWAAASGSLAPSRSRALGRRRRRFRLPNDDTRSWMGRPRERPLVRLLVVCQPVDEC